MERVRAGGCSPLRPHIDPAEGVEELEGIMVSCWTEKPAERPDFSSLRTAIKKLCPNGSVMKQDVETVYVTTVIVVINNYFTLKESLLLKKYIVTNLIIILTEA